MWLNLLCVVFITSVATSVIGCLIGSGIRSNKIDLVAGLYEIAAGMMTGIVCLEMLPESTNIAGICVTLIGCFIGILLTVLLDIFVSRTHDKTKASSLLIIAAMTLHNVVEGVAVGAGFIYSLSLGTTLLIANVLHDIPESIVVGIGINKAKRSFYAKMITAILLALPTTIGALLGNLVGSISDTYTAFSLSLSAGCMLYIVACDLIPSSKELTKKKSISLIYVLGIVLGLFLTNV